MKNLSNIEKIELIQKHKDEIKKIQDSFIDNQYNDSLKSGLTPIGRYVRRLRVMCDVTISEMAHSLNTTVPYLSGVECGRHTADNGYVMDVRDFFADEYDLYLSYYALLGMMDDGNKNIKQGE